MGPKGQRAEVLQQWRITGQISNQKLLFLEFGRKANFLMDSKSVRLRVEDEVVAQLFFTEGFLPLPLCGLVTKSLFSDHVPGSNAEFFLVFSALPSGKEEGGCLQVVNITPHHTPPCEVHKSSPEGVDSQTG